MSRPSMDEDERQDPLNSDIQSFIVKIWTEEPGDAEDGQSWRGQVTHVPDGERCTFQQLDELDRFILAHLNPGKSGPRERWSLRISLQDSENQSLTRPFWRRFPKLTLQWKPATGTLPAGKSEILHTEGR